MPRKKSTVPKEPEPKELWLCGLLPSDPAALHAHCSAGWTYISGNPNTFAIPNPGATQMDPALTALGNALKGAPGGTPADRKAVRSAAKKLRRLWGQLVDYVQGVLRQVSPADVPPILASCMMYVSQVGSRPPKPPLAAEHAATSGSVKLIALAIAGALTYDWEWSADQTIWSTSRSGESYTTIAGLTPGKQYWFRVRAFVRGNTLTDYVGPVALIVV